MKFFVCSDIHSAYTPWMDALNEAGFDEDNEEHKIVLCGDAFDRMDESKEVLRFIMDMVNKDKIVLIRGNHDLLLDECCMREYFQWHDVSNGTKRTIDDIGGAAHGRSFDECCQVTWNKMAGYRVQLVNYLETERYIFVHSWVPTNVSYDERASKPWHKVGKTYTYKPDWREATEEEWCEAMWGNPFEMAAQGLNQTGKILVMGHWHASAGWAEAEGRSEFGEDAKFDPYCGDGFIAIDACTAHTGKVNVIVLEDEILK